MVDVGRAGRGVVMGQWCKRPARRVGRLAPGAILGALFCLAGSPAAAQDFPGRPVRIVVPYGPGQAPDTLTRSLAQELNKATGQAFVVDNRTGADGVVAFEFVANQAPADGYTMVVAANTGLATLALTTKGLRFDPTRDLPPLVSMVEGKYAFSVPSSLPYKTFNELVAYVRANPGKTNYGSSNSTIHLQSEALMRGLGLSVVYVPYRQSNNYLQAIATNEVQMGFTSEGSILNLGQRARVLAVTGSTRSTKFPDAQTFAELGLPDIRGLSYTINARLGTPKPLFDRLEALVLAAMATPEVKATSAKLGLDPVAHPAAVSARLLAEESRIFSQVAKQIGLQAE